MRVGVLVMAKAPVPGLAKTRLAAAIGTTPAADLAAACLLDTIETVRSWSAAARLLVAVDGDLAASSRADDIAVMLQGCRRVPQRGADFAQRLLGAHQDAAALWGRHVPLVQIGTDTPQLTCRDLDALAAGVCVAAPDGVDATVGPAVDGGWWGLATRRAGYVDGLAGVEMSTPHTGEQTVEALRAAGARVSEIHQLSDVDVLADAVVVAAGAPRTRFAAALRAQRVEVAR